MNMVGFISGFEKRARGERVVASIGTVCGKAKRGPKPKARTKEYTGGKKSQFRKFSLGE